MLVSGVRRPRIHHVTPLPLSPDPQSVPTVLLARLDPRPAWAMQGGPPVSETNRSVATVALLRFPEFLSLKKKSLRSDMVDHTCNPSTQELQARIQGQSKLHRESEANLGYMRPCMETFQVTF